MTAKHGNTSNYVRRILVAALLTVALIAAATVDLGHGPAGPSTLFAPAFSVSPASSDSSTWYCAVPRLDKAPGVSIELELTNLTVRAQRAAIDFYAANGTDVHKSVSVAAASNRQVALSLPADKPGGVEIAFPGGGNVVGLMATGTQGYSQLLCQPSPGPQWLVEGMSTLGNSTGGLAVFNPFAADAIVDISFLTPSGFQQPGPLQAIVLKGHSTTEVYLPDWLQGVDPIAAQVTTRIGRVVAGAIEVRSDSAASGVVLPPVSAEIFSNYVFPLLSETTNQAVTLQLYNLSDTQQNATISIRPLASTGAESPTTTQASATTVEAGSPRFKESVPAQGTLGIPLKTIASVPIGTPFSMHVSGGVVALVVVKGSTAGPLAGLFEVPGVKIAWHRWLELAYGPPSGLAGNQVAMVVGSAANRGSGLVETFYFGRKVSPTAQLKGIDSTAGVPFVIDRTKVQVYASSFPGGLPAAFTISTSDSTVAAMALIGADGSLTPFSQIPVS